MDIAYEPSPSRPSPFSKINFRLIAILIVAAAPFLWFLKVIVQDTLTGGKIDRGSYIEVDLKNLGNFPFDEDRDTINDVPKRWRELDGKRVMLVGEMFSREMSGPTLDRFELVYSVQKCCFNGPPRVQERVFAAMPKGKETSFYGGNVRVIGTLHVNDKKDAGRTVSLYTLVVDSISPV